MGSAIWSSTLYMRKAIILPSGLVTSRSPCHSERKEMYFHSTLTWPSNPRKSRHQVLSDLTEPMRKLRKRNSVLSWVASQIKSKEKKSRFCLLFQQEESLFSLLSLHINAHLFHLHFLKGSISASYRFMWQEVTDFLLNRWRFCNNSSQLPPGEKNKSF